MAETDRPLIDRSMALPRGYTLTECINADGSTSFWILDDRIEHSVTVPTPQHERLGKLPTDVRDRLGLTCGALARTTGSPCRNRVEHPGEHCSKHRDANQDTLPFQEGACA